MFTWIAEHEAGHAIVAILKGMTVTEVAQWDVVSGWTDVDEADPAEEGVVAFGGLAAVDLVIGAVDPETEDQESDDCDIPKARSCAMSLVGLEGGIGSLMDEWREEAYRLLLPRKPLISSLAAELRRRRVMPGDEVRRFIAEAEKRSTIG